METPKRTLVKAITWQVMGILTMTMLGYLATGSVGVAGGLAISGALIGAVGYFVHERIWNRITWGRTHLGSSEFDKPAAGRADQGETGAVR
jgi:uncharacterized membrane protein